MQDFIITIIPIAAWAVVGYLIISLILLVRKKWADANAVRNPDKDK
jgi:hypothetical protein